VRPLLVVAAIGLAAVALFGVLIGHSVAKPLETIAARARGLTGNPDEQLPQVGGGPELRELVDALNRMLETLRRNEQLAVMGRMAAGVAHEIKNPLSAMKMTLQMLRLERPEREREPYDLVLREIERLDLAASELSASVRPLAKAPCALDRALAEVLDLLKPQLDHLGVKVERRLAPGAPVAVDESRFKRAAMNLILNGAQAMPQGGTLTVELAGTRFAVTDSGTGIAPELRDRIFEPFVTGRSDGVGLGLALTKRIVEDHGGTIGFETSDKGSTFWIEISPTP
jgi:signal transduction histidine kinase